MRTVHFVHQRGETMDYKHLIRFFLAKLKKDNIGAYAAQAALFIIMSAIPFLLVFLSLLIPEHMLLSKIMKLSCFFLLLIYYSKMLFRFARADSKIYDLELF